MATSRERVAPSSLHDDARFPFGAPFSGGRPTAPALLTALCKGHPEFSAYEEARAAEKATSYRFKQHGRRVQGFRIQSLSDVAAAVAIIPIRFFVPPTNFSKEQSAGTLVHHCNRDVGHYKCATSAVMAGLGDMLFQGQKAKKSVTSVPYDWKRTFKFMLKGFVEGWIWSIWYRHAELWCNHLTGLVTASVPKAKLVNTLISLVLDISVACPIIYSLWDIPYPALVMNRMKPREIPGQIKSKLGDMLIASFKIWTPVNVVIYNVPVQHRVVLMSVADVFWQSIVSSIVVSSSAILKDHDVDVAASSVSPEAQVPINSTISAVGLRPKRELKAVPAP